MTQFITKSTDADHSKDGNKDDQTQDIDNQDHILILWNTNFHTFTPQTSPTRFL